MLGYVQVLFNMLTFGFNPQQALDAPRIAISPHETAYPDADVHLESGVPPEAVPGLKKLGHNVVVETGKGMIGYFGQCQVIQASKMEEKGGQGWVFSAGSDPRGDGALALSGRLGAMCRILRMNHE
jgi:gamma-glutamyltranspeptidase/glutathione hydrolase